MALQPFKRIFVDNSKYKKFEAIPFMQSLAYTVQEFLYSDKVENDKYSYQLDGRIKLYDFMTMVAYFIFASVNDLGKSTIKGYIEDIKTRKRTYEHEDTIEYIENDGLLITQASHILIGDLLWTAFIYTKIRDRIESNKTWKKAANMLLNLAWEESGLKKDIFKELPHIKIIPKALDIIGLQIYNSVNEELSEKEPDNRLSEEQLKNENSELKKKIEELQNTIVVQNENLGSIDAASKIGLTFIMKLMENDGADFNKSGNKAIGAKVLKMLTGRSESACKAIFSDPLSPNYPPHRQIINELNQHLSKLGVKTLL